MPAVVSPECRTLEQQLGTIGRQAVVAAVLPSEARRQRSRFAGAHVHDVGAVPGLPGRRGRGLFGGRRHVGGVGLRPDDARHDQGRDERDRQSYRAPAPIPLVTAACGRAAGAGARTRSGGGIAPPTPCSRMERTSLIGSLQEIAKRCPPAVHASADRRRVDAEHAASFVGREAQPLGQDEGFALRAGDRRERPMDFVPGDHRFARILDRQRSEYPASTDRQFAEAAPVQVEGRSIDIAGGRVHRADPIPPLVGTEQGFLRHVVRLRGIADQQVQGLEEPLVLGDEEGLEGLVRRRSGPRRSGSSVRS